MSDTFIVKTDDVYRVGGQIITEADELLGTAEQPSQNKLSTDKDYSLYEFQYHFNLIKQNNFPDALQGVLGTFIQNQYNGYQDILMNRETVGFLLQNKVAADSDTNEYMTKQQFQEQLTNIQSGNW